MLRLQYQFRVYISEISYFTYIIITVNSKSKYIQIRYFFMQQHFDNGDFKLVHCPTDQMVADILTKPLQGSKFLKLRAKLLGHEYMLDE